MTGAQSPEIEARVAALQLATGCRVVLRPVSTPDPAFRGSLRRRGRLITIEYHGRIAGFFWDYDIIEQLLTYAEAGRTDVVLHEGE